MSFECSDRCDCECPREEDTGSLSEKLSFRFGTRKLGF